MAVRKKGRRKIICNGNNYVWYVDLDYESPLYLLHIVSEDKKMIIIYPVSGNYIVSQGKIFQGNEYHGWKRFFIPFESAEVITPEYVSKIIHWASDESNAVPVDDWGKIVYTNSRGYCCDIYGNKAGICIY